jgi:hypothetical protein
MSDEVNLKLKLKPFHIVLIGLAVAGLCCAVYACIGFQIYSYLTAPAQPETSQDATPTFKPVSGRVMTFTPAGITAGPATPTQAATQPRQTVAPNVPTGSPLPTPLPLPTVTSEPTRIITRLLR